MSVVVNHPIDLATYLPFQLHKLSALIALPRAIDAGSGIIVRVREWRVLLILVSHGPASGSDIARLTYMDTGSVARSSKELLRAGLVIARPDKVDKRKLLFSVSKEGAEVYDRIATARIAFADKIISSLDPEERKTMFAIFSKLEKSAAAIAQDQADPFSDC